MPVSQTVIVYKAPHVYCSHPCVTRLVTGDWLIAFCESVQREPFLHPPSDPRFLNVVTRSRDQGRTWEQPQVAPGYERYGVETPGIAQLSNGDVLLNQWHFVWYPVDLAKKLWSQGRHECFVADPGTSRWNPARHDDDWERHPYPYARADGGSFVHISTDNGHTWELSVPLDIGPYRGAFSPRGAVELSNGDVVLALGSHEHDPSAATFVVRSSDKGRSWQRPVQAARVPGLVFSEPSVVATSDDRLLLMSREEVNGCVYQSQSADGGLTWSTPKRMPFSGYPVHCIRLLDGRLVMVWGRRQEPFGIRAAISEDDGASWGPEIVIRDKMANDNLGYPSVIEYQPGHLFVAYYGEGRDGVTCIQGTYFELQGP
ncbi:MAG: sialidase family protein [Acidimicrobiales bacterium]